MFIYKYKENHTIKEEQFPTVEAARKQAIHDMGASDRYPMSIIEVRMEREDIEEAWAERFAA